MARARTFLAVELSPTAKAAAVDFQRALARATTAAGVKWVDPANLHVTLLFLGEVDGRDLVPLCRILDAAAARSPAFDLRVAGVGAFPTPRRPKTLYAGVTDGAAELTALHALLQPPLMELGVTRREDRAYSPHLTLGRVTVEADGDLIAAELPKHAAWTAGASAVAEVVLFTSELRRAGPEYTAVSRAALG